MGCANSLVAAVSGHDVIIHDVDAVALAGVADRHAEIGDFLVAVGYATAETLERGLARVRCVPDLDDLAAHADLVSESVVEQLAVKRAVHHELSERCRSDAIITTNTSHLLVSEIADTVERPERFAALHSYLGSLLFDVMPGPATAPATVDALVGYVEGLGGTPLVLAREHRGYVVNGLIGGLLSAALGQRVIDGVSVETVDRAWMTHRRAPMGPFGMIDLFGLDVVLDSRRRSGRVDGDPAQGSAVNALLSEMIAAGRGGTKTGAGFYDYPEPSFRQPTFVEARAGDDELHAVLLGAVVERAEELARVGIAEPDRIDEAWMAVMGLDAGPFALRAERFQRARKSSTAADTSTGRSGNIA